MKVVPSPWLWVAGIVCLAVLAGILLVFLSNIRDFDVSDFAAEEITFLYGDAEVAGTLHLPQADTPPLLVLVHGDGPQDRYAGDSLLPLIRVLLENGIAVFSWDKPGIGASSGNWLTHSMADRSALAASAIETLSHQTDQSFASIGVLGFSQAGWVLPDLALRNTAADHFIIVGGAINWLRQGEYHTRIRLERDGVSPDKIDEILTAQARGNANFATGDLTYEAYVSAHTGDGAPMPEDRFHFAKINMQSDATHALQRVAKPFFSVHGADDLNVDPQVNSAAYRKLLTTGHPMSGAVVLPNATHGLLRADLFNYQQPSDMPVWAVTRFVLSGRNAYAPGALDLIVTRTKQAAPRGH